MKDVAIQHKCLDCKKTVTILDPISESFYKYSNRKRCKCGAWIYNFKTKRWNKV